MQTSGATMMTSMAAPSSPAKPTEAATKQQFSDPSVLYPLASSGRGLLSAPRGLLPQFPQPARPYQPITTAYQHQPFLHSSSSHISSLLAPPPPLRPHAQPLLKATPPGNNYDKDLKDKVADDTFFIIRDRKVRISDRGSVYALCRSWLSNGYPEQSQPQYGDTSKSLQRPLPMPDSTSSKRKENDDETESDEEEKTVGSPRAEALLRGHIKRAKRIRERLREERLQRIKRYRGRLSLLLPLPVDQCRNDVGDCLTREVP